MKLLNNIINGMPCRSPDQLMSHLIRLKSLESIQGNMMKAAKPYNSLIKVGLSSYAVGPYTLVIMKGSYDIFCLRIVVHV
jgi:hypothetical protein